MAKNLCGKMRDVDHPYEIWVADGWEWRVLKKYQADDYKPYARWHVAVMSPLTRGRWEYGDSYASSVMEEGMRVQ